MTEHKRQTTDEIRHLIILKYEAGKSIKDISLELNIKYCTAGSIIRRYKKTNLISVCKNRCPKQKKVTTEAKHLILRKLDEDASITLRKLKESLENELNICVSLPTIERELNILHYSFKRLQLVPEARNTEANIQKRFEYANLFLSLNEQSVIFMDEMGVNCSLRMGYGRSVVGTPARKNVRALRSRNYSVSAAINRDGVLFFKTINQPYNGERYELFLNELFEILRSRGIKNANIVLDNCSIHKVKAVMETIKQHGHHVLFLPPYSPQLNPIEELFSKWKNGIKSANVQNIDELYSAISRSHEEITVEDCAGYFSHMREYALKAIRKEDF